MKRFAVLALALVASCSTPEVSQIILRLEADPNVAAMTRSIEVQIDGGATRSAFTNADTVTLDGGNFPREIALAPKGDDPSRYYRVVARARREGLDQPDPQTFAQAALIGTYVRGETRVVVLRIEDSCIDVICDTNDHCTGARCVPPPDATPLTDGAVTDMGMPESDMGPPTRCGSDADCDDEIPCTVDACTSGTCTHTPSNALCDPPANPCLRAVCLPGEGCSEEPQGGTCDNDTFCDGDDSCVDGVCVGDGSPSCVGMSVCEPSTGDCTGCAGPADCTDGQLCMAGECVCPGTAEDCDLPGDEDCDGRANCADPDCMGNPCGPNGRVCLAGVCDCPETSEMLCGDGIDNDCDGQTDCVDSAECEGESCAPGSVCAMGSCVLDVFEICNNGDDDDMDGLVDCADRADCDGESCTDPGSLGVGTCVDGICQPRCMEIEMENTESACSDGMDNDCDRDVDCEDDDCSRTCVCGVCPFDGGIDAGAGDAGTDAGTDAGMIAPRPDGATMM